MTRDYRRLTIAVTLLGLLLSMCLLIVFVLTIDEAPSSHGFAHPQHRSTMLQGGSGVERHNGVRWIGLAFGLSEVGFFVGCLLLGVPRLEGRIRIFVLCGLFYAMAFALLVTIDHFYAHGDLRTIVLGFPLPTAVMVYGVGGAPLAFVLLYMVRFDQWILTPEDYERFEQLVRAKRECEESDA